VAGPCCHCGDCHLDELSDVDSKGFGHPSWQVIQTLPMDPGQELNPVLVSKITPDNRNANVGSTFVVALNFRLSLSKFYLNTCLFSIRGLMRFHGMRMDVEVCALNHEALLNSKGGCYLPSDHQLQHNTNTPLILQYHGPGRPAIGRAIPQVRFVVDTTAARNDESIINHQ